MTCSDGGPELPLSRRMASERALKDRVEFEAGEGRPHVVVRATRLGNDLVVYIFNKNAHLGAVAIGEWNSEHHRASVSVHTRPGHKDDAVAQAAAHAICKSTRSPVCVIAGIHLQEITSEEIKQVLSNVEIAVGRLVDYLSRGADPLL